MFSRILLLILICVTQTNIGYSQPNRIWATYLGDGIAISLGTETSNVIYSPDGYIYVAGCVFDTTINLATPGSFIPTFPATNYASSTYLSKFDTLGNRIWGTYVGNSTTTLWPRIALDGAGNIVFTAHIGGTTANQNNIGTPGTFNPTIPPAGTQLGGYSFLIKFNPSGQRLWGTYLESSSPAYTANFFPYGITTDQNNNIIVCGMDAGANNYTFPSSGTYKPQPDSARNAFIVKYSPSGNLIWGSYYGGNNTDIKYVTCDNVGNIYFGGNTDNTSGITTNGTSYPIASMAYNGYDSYLAKFNSAGQRVWATYTNGIDWLGGIKYSADGFLYIAGITSRDTGVATSGVYQEVYGGNNDIALIKWTNTGQKVWGTYYGGSGIEFMGGVFNQYGVGLPIGRMGIDLDASGNILITGGTFSNNGIRYGCTYSGHEGDTTNGDGFIAKFYNNGKIMWGSYFDTYLKSVSAGPGQNFYLVSETTKDNISTPGCFQPSKTAGKQSGYIVRMQGDYICPTINEAIQADSNQLSISSSYGNYQWFYNGQAISGATSSSFNAVDSGNYMVTFENNCACQYTSIVYTYDPNHPGGTSILDVNANNNVFSIFPNPVANGFKLILKNGDHKIETANIELTDLTGKSIMKEVSIELNAQGNSKTIQTQSLVSGMYFLNISYKGYRYTYKLIKQ